jgi:hypothetical protein
MSNLETNSKHEIQKLPRRDQHAWVFISVFEFSDVCFGFRLPRRSLAKAGVSNFEFGFLS